VAVKLVKRGDISVHDRDALVMSTSDEYAADMLKALDDRYGKDAEGKSLVQGWIAYLRSLPEWVPGTAMVQLLGPKQDQKVIFICIADKNGKSSYPYIRDAMQKLAKKRKTLEVETVAMPFIGVAKDSEVNRIALEPVIAAAVGEELHVDLYEEFLLNEKVAS